MSDHDHPEPEGPIRQTAPQGDYEMGDVWTGLIVAVVGLVVTMGLPLVLV